MILEKISKLAEKLDEEGYFEAADELTEILITAAGLTAEAASKFQLRIPVEERAEQNEWLASLNLWQDGQLRVANLEQVSSPIYQNEELRQAGNKQAGIDEMKRQLRAHLAGFNRRHPEYRQAVVVIENPLFR